MVKKDKKRKEKKRKDKEKERAGPHVLNCMWHAAPDAAYCSILPQSALHCASLQHAGLHCNID